MALALDEGDKFSRGDNLSVKEESKLERPELSSVEDTHCPPCAGGGGGGGYGC
jgi:hypothetical protein